MTKYEEFLAQKGEIISVHDTKKLPTKFSEKVANLGSHLKKFAEKGIKVAYQGAQLLSALKNNGIEINLIKVVQAEKTQPSMAFLKDNSKDRL